MAINPPPKAVTFDAAGTLLQVAEPVGTTYARFASLHGIETDPYTIGEIFLRHLDRTPSPHSSPGRTGGDKVERRWWRSLVFQIFRDAAGKTRIGDKSLDPLFEDLFRYYADSEAWRLMPDVTEVLQMLKGNVRTGVISNFDQRFHSISRGLGLSKYFDSITLSSEVRACKPDPAIFAAAARKLQTEPSGILHVGDDPIRDWEGARGAGFQVFQLNAETNPLSKIAARFDFRR